MYATVADFIAAFGEEEAIALSNLDDASVETIDSSVIIAALRAASADLDSYLKSAGYGLPLAEIPAVLVDRTVNIARYKLDRNRAREEVRQRYLDAIFWCKDLAKGLASLDLSAVTGTDTSAAMPVYYQSDRIFTLASLSDY